MQQMPAAAGICQYAPTTARTTTALPCWAGALAGVENGLVLVLGTGIGGGIILNGKVLMGAHAAAGEVSCLVSNMAAKKLNYYKSLG